MLLGSVDNGNNNGNDNIGADTDSSLTVLSTLHVSCAGSAVAIPIDRGGNGGKYSLSELPWVTSAALPGFDPRLPSLELCP